MLDETTRKAYLNTMGITQWQLREGDSDEFNNEDEPSSQSGTESSTQRQVQPSHAIPELAQSNEINKSEVALVPDTSPNYPIIEGLSWLNNGSTNGLLVVLSEERKKLGPEARVLMSKMLKGIQFLPSETGFAVSNSSLPIKPATETNKPVSLESIKAILVFGNDAGRQMVKMAGAKIIPGTEFFSLQHCKIVVTVHPEELLAQPKLKQQTWTDLKQLVSLFNAPI